MARKEPKPRVCRFYGTTTVATVGPEGTWIEDEAFAYPNNTYTRRARALCDDGVLRVFRCCCADTYFSVPARGKIAGRSVKGFVSSDSNGLLEFHETDA